MFEIVWKRAAYAERGFIGKWHIFTVHTDISNIGKYTLKCRLPGIRNTYGPFDSKQAAQDAAMPLFNHWKEHLDE